MMALPFPSRPAGQPPALSASASRLGPDPISTSTMVSDAAIGYLAMLVAALGFGSNFLPVKKCETGNGLAFQFFFCWAVWLVGLGVGAYRGFPSTPPLALLGGALWCTGNLLSVPAIKLIGLGLSLLIWGVSNMCVGWASSTFGILGVQTQHVAKPALNYSGAAIAVLALLVYLFVKPTQALPATEGATSSSSFKRGSSGLYAGRASPSLQSSLLVEEEEEEEGGLRRPGSTGGGAAGGGDGGRDEHGADVFLPSLVGPPRFITGVVAALSAGLLFGSSFNASYYIMDHASPSLPPSSYSKYEDLEMLDFVFAHFNGIFLTSSTYFLLALLLYYLSSYRKNTAVRKPIELYPATLLPAFASGLLWAIAMVAWFVANQKLTSLSVTFPIITSTPGLVASLWGVLVFGEIKGKRNLWTLAGAFSLTVISCCLIAFSK